MAELVKRAYQSPVRAAAAARTRARLRAAAGRLFITQGYAATTMRQVAREAAVGERTLYDAFPAKAALFRHTLGVAVAGDEEPVPVAQRPWVQAALAEPDPVTTLSLLAANTATLLERAGDLIMVSIEAAAADPDMRAGVDADSQATHDVLLAFAASLSRRGALRAGLTGHAAADVLYVFLAPHTYQLLRRHRRWSAQQYRQWLTGAITRELLADPGPR
jgi:AcrR family transcriptional regulator